MDGLGKKRTRSLEETCKYTNIIRNNSIRQLRADTYNKPKDHFALATRYITTTLLMLKCVLIADNLQRPEPRAKNGCLEKFQVGLGERSRKFARNATVEERLV